MARKKHIGDAIRVEAIREYSDFQLDWNRLIPPLRKGHYVALNAADLSIHGDASKCFLRIQEYEEGRPTTKLRQWNGYIAKLGSKFYPNESITEHLCTRIGETCGANVAKSQLMVVGTQVRFLSRFFLREGRERLVHGIEIFKNYLCDEEMVEDIAEQRLEREFYTFQTVRDAVEACFPRHGDLLMLRFVEMLGFDALVGNQDRHPMNWGVIERMKFGGQPRFSPIFDTARGLLWRVDELRLDKMSRDQHQFSAFIERSVPQIGWEHNPEMNHFSLIGAIFSLYPEYRTAIAKFASECVLESCLSVVKEEFSHLMSELRVRMIQECLRHRHRRLCEVTAGGNA